jgi:hypothetical protein
MEEYQPIDVYCSREIVRLVQQCNLTIVSLKSFPEKRRRTLVYLCVRPCSELLPL